MAGRDCLMQVINEDQYTPAVCYGAGDFDAGPVTVTLPDPGKRFML
jgi:hypothetical protein